MSKKHISSVSTNIVHKSTCISLLLIIAQPNKHVAHKKISLLIQFELRLYLVLNIELFLPIGAVA